MEVADLSPDVAKVPKNFRALLFGASEAGKSHWIGSLIRNKDKVFPAPGYAKFIYCSPNLGESALSSNRDLEYQKNLREWAAPSEIIFLNNIITEEELFEQAEAANGPTLLIIDDYSQELFATDLVYKLFTRLSSHGTGISTVVSVHQTLGSKTPGKWNSLIFSNSNFFVIFRNIANKAAIGELSKRIFPYGKNFIQRALNEAVNICGNYAYVFVDASLRNSLNNKFGIRINIFEENGLPMLMMKSPTVYHGSC